ncbi:hypothetical protein PF005_g2089 [Phytophthora fragariae]|nr:hypothetical protein PF003_g35163 [Phytophthora fragariae]KAE8983607.1 hypothetical protein PR002_g23203 [Phytophthora rubi]KAE8887551.1 hypothetical protein PF003_g28386 [Phytophthora fragariae]KAE8898578.1 hypothetical protein PF003_g17491 [Phytophthora fragariae]KAE8948139.1 hypothetical protein PF009_g2273 [Phytophthora fragariae]
MAKWTIQRMEAAVEAYRKGQRQPKKVPIREISRMYDVPDPTLRRYLNMGHMAEARVLNPNISATTEAFGAYKVSATTQSSGLDDGAAPASLCVTPVLQQPIVYFADL